MEPFSEVLHYEHNKDTKIWRTITLKDFNDEMEELLKVFSTWKETTGVSDTYLVKKEIQL